VIDVLSKFQVSASNNYVDNSLGRVGPHGREKGLQ
jgi:hypothetical protein